VTGSGGLSGIDVADDDDVNVGLLLTHCEDVCCIRFLEDGRGVCMTQKNVYFVRYAVEDQLDR
jgi:hypothetical protein